MCAVSITQNEPRPAAVSRRGKVVVASRVVNPNESRRWTRDVIRVRPIVLSVNVAASVMGGPPILADIFTY